MQRGRLFGLALPDVPRDPKPPANGSRALGDKGDNRGGGTAYFSPSGGGSGRGTGSRGAAGGNKGDGGTNADGVVDTDERILEPPRSQALVVLAILGVIGAGVVAAVFGGERGHRRRQRTLLNPSESAY